jgi:hypothetical protein
VPSPRTASVFGISLAPFRKGPLRLAASWSFVSVRGPDGEAFGFGDPKFFARMVVAGNDSSALHASVEGMARLPTASAKLFPYAFGGQEIELWGVAGIGGRYRRLTSGVARSWTEPSPGLSASEVPKSVRAFAQMTWRPYPWAARLRTDAWWMDGGTRRNAADAELTHFSTQGFAATIAGSVEFGPQADRAIDSSLGLRFAMRLR